MFKELALTEIGLCPWNPRKNLEGSKFDELVASVAQKGVIQPNQRAHFPKPHSSRDAGQVP